MSKVWIKCDINAMYEFKQNLMRSSSNNSVGYTKLLDENSVSVHTLN